MGETPNHLLPAGYQDFQFPADRMSDTVSFFQETEIYIIVQPVSKDVTYLYVLREHLTN